MQSTLKLLEQIVGYNLYLNLFVATSVVIIGILNYRFLTKPIRFFLVYQLLYSFSYLALLVFIEWVTFDYHFWEPLLTKFKIADTFFWGIVPIIIDYIFLARFFEELSFTKQKIWLRGLTMVLFILSFYIYIYIDGYNQYAKINSIINRAYILIFTIRAFNILILKVVTINFSKQPLSFILAGLIISNFLGFLFTFFAADLQKNNYSWFLIMTVINNLLIVTGQVFYGLAFWNAKYVLKV